LLRFADARPTAEVLFAQRSAALLDVGLGAAFARCRKILTTDLDWPPYRQAVAAAAIDHGAEVECVPLHDLVFRDRASPADVIEVIRDCYRRTRCDGLFLTAVTNTGVRLPTRAVVEAITRSAGRPRFVLVDGTQALGHVPEVLRDAPYDFYLAGCHKWLRAQHPLAVAVFAEPLTGQRLRRSIREHSPGELIDPLLAFTWQLEGCKRNWPRFGETVNVTPLLTARAALADPTAGALWTISLNCSRIEKAAATTGWERVATHPHLSSGILLYRPVDTAMRQRTPETTRAKFHQHGVALTAYDGSVLRLSTPKGFVADWQYERLPRALLVCA
jgi:selenocysteine lyase/cysteine desulfurase